MDPFGALSKGGLPGARVIHARSSDGTLHPIFSIKPTEAEKRLMAEEAERKMLAEKDMQLRAKIQEIKDLREELEILRGEEEHMNAVVTENEQLHRRIREKDALIQQLNAKHQQELDALKQENEQMTKLNATLVNKSDKLEAELAELKREKESLDLKMRDAIFENTQIKQLYEEKRAEFKLFMSNTSNSKDELIKKLEQNLADALAKRDQLAQALDKAELEIENYQRIYKDTRDSSEEELVFFKQQVETLTQKYNEAIIQKEEILRNQNAEIERLMREVNDSKTPTGSFAGVTSSSDKKRGIVFTLSNSLLSTTLVDGGSGGGGLNFSSSFNSRTPFSFKQLREVIIALKERNVELAKQIMEVNRQKEEVLASVDNKVLEHQAEREELQRQLSILRSQESEWAAMKVEMALLRTKNEELIRRCDTLEPQLRETTEMAAKYKAELGHTKFELEKLREETAKREEIEKRNKNALNAEIERLKQEIARDKQQITDEHEKRIKAENLKARAEQDIQQKLRDVKYAKEQLEKQLKEKTAQCDRMYHDIVDLKDKLNRETLHRKSLEDKCKHFDTNRVLFDREMKEARDTIRKLETEKTQLERDLSSYRRFSFSSGPASTPLSALSNSSLSSSFSVGSSNNNNSILANNGNGNGIHHSNRRLSTSSSIGNGNNNNSSMMNRSIVISTPSSAKSKPDTLLSGSAVLRPVARTTTTSTVNETRSTPMLTIITSTTMSPKEDGGLGSSSEAPSDKKPIATITTTTTTNTNAMIRHEAEDAAAVEEEDDEELLALTTPKSCSACPDASAEEEEENLFLENGHGGVHPSAPIINNNNNNNGNSEEETTEESNNDDQENELELMMKTEGLGLDQSGRARMTSSSSSILLVQHIHPGNNTSTEEEEEEGGEAAEL